MTAILINGKRCVCVLAVVYVNTRTDCIGIKGTWVIIQGLWVIHPGLYKLGGYGILQGYVYLSCGAYTRTNDSTIWGFWRGQDGDRDIFSWKSFEMGLFQIYPGDDT